MKLTVTNTSPLPLYRQMYDQLAAQILRGEIAPGEVPPIRTVAQELSVSLISVRRAWEELERDGFIHTAVGRGTFAAALGETDKAAMRRAILKEKLTDAAQFCAAVGASGEEAAALLAALLEQPDSAPAAAAPRALRADARMKFLREILFIVRNPFFSLLVFFSQNILLHRTQFDVFLTIFIIIKSLPKEKFNFPVCSYVFFL